VWEAKCVAAAAGDAVGARRRMQKSRHVGCIVGAGAPGPIGTRGVHPQGTMHRAGVTAAVSRVTQRRVCGCSLVRRVLPRAGCIRARCEGGGLPLRQRRASARISQRQQCLRPPWGGVVAHDHHLREHARKPPQHLTHHGGHHVRLVAKGLECGWRQDASAPLLSAAASAVNKA